MEIMQRIVDKLFQALALTARKGRNWLSKMVAKNSLRGAITQLLSMAKALDSMRLIKEMVRFKNYK